MLSKDSIDMTLVSLLLIFIIAFSLAFAGCWASADQAIILRKEAIERGFAEYNQVTGEWQWKGGEDELRPKRKT